jgi:beta-N-acetylhexosaminidase
MKKLLLFVPFFLLTAGVAVFPLLWYQSNDQADVQRSMVTMPLQKKDVRLERTHAAVANMSLPEKVGQLFMVSFSGTALTDEEVAWLVRLRVGGVILMGGNVATEGQSQTLVAQLHERVSSVLSTPLLIATDQEGGAVSRFTFFDAEEHTAQNEIKTAEEALALGKLRGAALRNMGIDVVFSPVLDIAQSLDDFMATRAFRGNATTVSELGAAFILGYREGRMLATAKHFPGHGGTITNSHRNLPVVHRDENAWAENLAPFQVAIAADVPLIMTAHILVPEVDTHYPASLSSIITTGVLRDTLNFQGVIITDDLAMGAVTDTYSLSDAAILAFTAGADILLMISDHSSIESAVASVTAAVKSGQISSERLDESVERILLLKDMVAQQQVF